MSSSKGGTHLQVIEICAGAGGQSLGLERAGFHHRLAIELDDNAAKTLKHNRPDWDVRVGDVADPATWDPEQYTSQVALLAGGVPCPPFSIAGKQLGANDERDLFAWAVELCGRVRPNALLLENVRGLSANRFSAYRQHVLDRLREHGYIGEWKLLHANEFGVPQLRPRFVLVALLPEYAQYFTWPEPNQVRTPTVGEALKDLMASGGWNADDWADQADSIAPTIVGGSKKHGGADLGPTRAKRAWAALGVDAMGVADNPPSATWKPQPNSKGEMAPGPKLTTAMVARIQGWQGEFSGWEFQGRKTTVYRQIGNAFPPPMAKAVGESIWRALHKEGVPHALIESTSTVQDPVYKLLRGQTSPLSLEQIITRFAKDGTTMDLPEVERRLNHLSHDFEVTATQSKSGSFTYTLGEFKAFIGQDDHQRHDLFSQHRTKIS
jgi:DNA (cytosine-5)-methyltransferase 1